MIIESLLKFNSTLGNSRVVLSHGHGSIVLKDGGRIGEVNPIFSQVRPRLALVPLKPHNPAHMHKRTSTATVRPTGPPLLNLLACAGRLSHHVEDVIARALRLRAGVDDQRAIIAELLK